MTEIDALHSALRRQIELTASLSCVAQGKPPLATLPPEQQKQIIVQSTHHEAALVLKGLKGSNRDEAFRELVTFLNGEGMPFCISCGWNHPMHDSKCKLFPLLKIIQGFW